MKRFLFCVFTLSICGLASVSADETVRAVQKRLKDQGFYLGEENGVYDSATQAAVSRYQIRNGLSITGRLDPETVSALRVASEERNVRTPKVGEDVWRYLRKSDQEQILQMMADDSARARPGSASARTAASPSPPAEGGIAQQQNVGSNNSSPAAENDLSAKDRERLRDYVGAFILAGLDPRTGSELEFFADSVNYFGKPDQRREAIKQDLERYNRQWPDRRFWLAGDLEVEPQSDGRVIVTFPLRYELRHGPKQASGQVEKTLVLQAAGEDLQIVGVNERKQKANR
jgi:peptidoglycan hydrolase-like protein with peptidoglycan-binding domain